MYTTRVIEIEPYFGWVGWGGPATYPKPILKKWDRVDFPGSKITANDAIRIANEDAKERFHFENNCAVFMISPQYDYPKNWYLYFFIGGRNLFAYIVNLDTGDYVVRNKN